MCIINIECDLNMCLYFMILLWDDSNRVHITGFSYRKRRCNLFLTTTISDSIELRPLILGLLNGRSSQRELREKFGHNKVYLIWQLVDKCASFKLPNNCKVHVKSCDKLNSITRFPRGRIYIRPTGLSLTSGGLKAENSHGKMQLCASLLSLIKVKKLKHLKRETQYKHYYSCKKFSPYKKYFACMKYFLCNRYIMHNIFFTYMTKYEMQTYF